MNIFGSACRAISGANSWKTRSCYLLTRYTRPSGVWLRHECPHGRELGLDPRTAAAKKTVNISVVICTYNRCDSLRRTLQTFCQINAAAISWELLVLDNNSTDATACFVEEFKDKLPLRYIFESRQGKSYALNHSVREAQGSLLLFTDDDVDVDPQWLQAYWSVAQRFPDAAFLRRQSRRLVGKKHRPPGFAGNETWLHARRSRGWRPATNAWMKPGERPFFLGANMAVRREIFGQKFSFPENIGPSGSDASQSGNVRGEEMQLQGEFIVCRIEGLLHPQSADQPPPPSSSHDGELPAPLVSRTRYR